MCSINVVFADIPKTTISGESTAEAGSPAEEASSPSSGKQNETEGSDKDKEEEAATRIQAVFRGHHARKSMKETEASSQKGTKSAAEDSEPTQEQLQEEFRADDKGKFAFPPLCPIITLLYPILFWKVLFFLFCLPFLPILFLIQTTLFFFITPGLATLRSFYPWKRRHTLKSDWIARHWLISLPD